MKPSEFKEAALADLCLIIGRKLDPENYRSWHDDRRWSEAIQKNLSRLTLRELNALSVLIQDGPIQKGNQ
jgi:hypothetical protein